LIPIFNHYYLYENTTMKPREISKFASYVSDIQSDD
jgi:hypothetical protein